MRSMFWIAAIALAVAACGSETNGETTVDAAATPDMGSATDAANGGDAARDAESRPDASGPDVRADVDMGPFGGDRPAKVVLPRDWSASGSYPVVVLLHGYSANSTLQNAFFQAGLLVDELQFVLVLPEGTTNPAGAQYWNATECCDFYGANVDDATYLIDLGEDAVARYGGDPKRLYFMGHSNGGYMSYRLACDYSTRIAAIASVAGSSWIDPADCGTPSPVPVLQMHGTADTTVWFDGVIGRQPGAREVVSRWVERDGCIGDSDFLGTAEYDSAAGINETSKEAWRNCEGDSEVQLWTMNDSGHIPRVGQPFTRDILGFLFEHQLQ